MDKKSVIYAFKTASKRVFEQIAEATNNLFGRKNVEKVTKTPSK